MRTCCRVQIINLSDPAGGTGQMLTVAGGDAGDDDDHDENSDNFDIMIGLMIYYIISPIIISEYQN